MIGRLATRRGLSIFWFEISLAVRVPQPLTLIPFVLTPGLHGHPFRVGFLVRDKPGAITTNGGAISKGITVFEER